MNKRRLLDIKVVCLVILIVLCNTVPLYAQEVADTDKQTQETEQELKDENQNALTDITGMDEDGNVVSESGEPGAVDNLQGKGRAATGKIVNFNTKGNVVTNYVEFGTNTNGYTCGAYGADAAYLGTVNGKVKFMLSGVIGLVSASEVQVVDIGVAKSMSHYIVSGGRLLHKITTNISNSSYPSSLDNGPAPSFLKEGVKYYSYDGNYFYTLEAYSQMINEYNSNARTSAVNAATPYYNYYQYLPLRSKSAYSAADFNVLINSKVNSSSKMYNLGQDVVDVQNSFGVNALIASGVAANESAWGNSNICKQKNNLFGINAVDSSPNESANFYPNVRSCVIDFGETYMSKQYLNPSNWKYEGGFVGNKGSGINIRYASDPYWGEKAANVAWLLDKVGGYRDASRYTIGIKDTISGLHTNLNIRKESNTSSTVLFQTKGNANQAFIIKNETPSNGFYMIQSDAVLNSGRTGINTSVGAYNYDAMYAYASSSYVKIASRGSGGGNNNSGGGGQEPPQTVAPVQVPESVKNGINYTSHIQGTGWQQNVSNGYMSGTLGLSKRMEAFKLNIANISGLGIEYSAHVQGTGWQNYVANGALAGTEGKSLRVEGMRMRLNGEKSSSYDIYYRVHAQGYGWLDWAKNGEPAGTSGESKRLESFQIALLPKGSAAPGSTSKPFVGIEPTISYTTHIQNYGWLTETSDGASGGSEGQSKRMEAMKIVLKNQPYTGNISYSAHVQTYGWQNFVSAGQVAGTNNQSKRLEAIMIKLTGQMADKYDVYYRVHAQTYGWLDWAKNGSAAGTEAQSKRLEAIQIVLVEKGAKAPGSTNRPFIK